MGISSTRRPVFLPNEIIFDILSRVPVKSLCRFRSVSIEWHALISDPVFIAAAKKSLPAEPLLVIGSSSESCLRLVDMDGRVVKVIYYTGCSWAPVCMNLVDGVVSVSVTGSFEGTPVAGMIDLVTMDGLVTRLDCDRVWGSGRAVPSGTHKVVRFKSYQYECEVITIGDGGGWRKMKSSTFCFDCGSRDNYTAAVDGMLHFWDVRRSFAAGVVLRFDLESEEWKSTIKAPPGVCFGRSEVFLGNLNGALCMAEAKRPFDTNRYTNIWLLTDADKSLWVMAYQIPLDPSTYYQMMPLRVLENGRKLLFRYNKKGRAPVLQIYDHYYGTCTNAMNNLLGDHVSGIGFCSLHLEGFISPKIQYPESCVRFF